MKLTKLSCRTIVTDHLLLLMGSKIALKCKSVEGGTKIKISYLHNMTVYTSVTVLGPEETAGGQLQTAMNN